MDEQCGECVWYLFLKDIEMEWKFKDNIINALS
jgi:hypothetical protein